MGRLEEQDFDEKRLARRQRRKRSQLIALIILLSTVILIGVACAFGIHAINKYLGAKKVQQEEAAAIASSENENIVIETPSDETTEPVEMTENDVLEEIVNGCVNELTLEEKAALPALYATLGERFKNLDDWSMYIITAYDGVEAAINRKADKNRKIYNGMMKTYFYSFMGKKPGKKQ